MVVLGLLIGFAQIVLGILIICFDFNQPLMVGMGIGYILSGFLFIWLCIGAFKAFDNAKKIGVLSAKYKKLKESNTILQGLLIEKGLVSKEDIDSALNSSINIKDMEPGFPLITLKDKTIRDGTITIPKNTQVSFSKYDDYSYSETVIVVTYKLNGEVLRLKYGVDDVINAYSFNNKVE